MTDFFEKGARALITAALVATLAASAFAEESVGVNGGYRRSNIFGEHLKGLTWSLDGNSSLRRAALEASYDIRSQMPPVRSQGVFGNCWAFAATAATESNLITKGLAAANIELSPWYLTYFAFMPQRAASAFSNPYSYPYYSVGGNDWLAVALLARGTGSVPASAAPSPASTAAAYAPSETARSYKLTDALYLGMLGASGVQISGETRSVVKQAVKDYGAVSVGIYFDMNVAAYYNSGSCAYYASSGYTAPNHAVNIVGWDDNYSRANFATQPTADGAWIARNSYGSSFGENGYFYVSYEEGSLCDGVAYVTETAPANDTIYQYDPLGCVAFVSVESGDFSYNITSYDFRESDNPVWYSNVFTPTAADTIGSVSFYTSVPEQVCEISVYTGCFTNPTSGAPAASKTVTLAAPGYHTVKLDADVSVAAYKKFSVVVKTSGKNLTSYIVPCEFRASGYSENAGTNAGESYISLDGETFYDVSATGNSLSGALPLNVCLKAFSSAPASSSGGGSSDSGSSGGSDDSGGGGCNASCAPFALFAVIPLIVGRKNK